MERLEVEDWKQEGRLVIIDIPPLKAASDHAAALYQTARRQRRGVSALVPLLEVGFGLFCSRVWALLQFYLSAVLGGFISVYFPSHQHLFHLLIMSTGSLCFPMNTT
jgi:hypothetical protein